MSMLPDILRRTDRRIAFVNGGANPADMEEWFKRAFGLLDVKTSDLFHSKRFKTEEELADYVAEKDYPISDKFERIHAAIVTVANGPNMEIKLRMNTTGMGEFRSDVPEFGKNENPAIDIKIKGYHDSVPKTWFNGGDAGITAKDEYPQGGFLDIQQMLMTYNLVKRGSIPDPTLGATAPAADLIAWRSAYFNSAYMMPDKHEDDFKDRLTEKLQTTVQLLTSPPAGVTLPAPFDGSLSAEDALKALSNMSADDATAARSSLSIAVNKAIGAIAQPLIAIKFRETSFPHRDFVEDPFLAVAGDFLAYIFVLAFLFPLSRMIKYMMEEKFYRILEGSKTMGLIESTITASWYLIYLIEFVVCAFLTTIGFKLMWPDTGVDAIFFLLLLFGLSTLSYALLLQSFFSVPKIASVIGSVLYLILYFPFSMSGGNNSMSPGTKLGVCLAAPSCFAEGVYVLNSFQNADNAITSLSHGWRTVNGMSVNGTLLMLIFDIVVYTLLSFYFDNVVQKEWGVALPWNYFLRKSYWASSSKPLSDKDLSDRLAVMHKESKSIPKEKFEGEFFEADSFVGSRNPSVELRGLRKTFTNGKETFTAVEGSWLRLYDGEILALLGHNGAGKTTTISMMTGMLPVTAGDAKMYGLSIANGDLAQARKMIGFCPQHDILFPHMTVREHLEFFCVIKGVPEEKQKEDIDEQLRLVGLLERDWQQAVSLSGGQKRRLSVAIALLGGSKIVFLDEPSTGVDPYMRHQLWDALKEARKNRVIILTTHFMEEADYLGDKVAIMANGQVKCMGTPLFLKSKYGAGHTLSVNKINGSQEINDRVIRFVRSKVPQADINSQVAAEVQFRLPFGAPGIADIIERFEAADAQESLGVLSFALGVTTLEEVFLQAGAHGDHGNMAAVGDNAKRQENTSISTHDGGVVRSVESGAGITPINDNGLPVTGRVTLTPPGIELFGKHIKALMLKRAHASKRDKRGWICQVLLPVIFVFLALTVLSIDLGETKATTLLPNDKEIGWSSPAQIRYTYADSAAACVASGPSQLLSSGFDTVFVNVKGQKSVDNEVVDGTSLSLSKHLLELERTDEDQTVDRFVALNVRNCPSAGQPFEVDFLYNSTARDALPLGLLETFNAYSKGLSGKATSTPKEGSFKLVFEPLPATSFTESFSDTFTAIFLGIGFSFIPAFWGLYVVREKEVKAKHMQFVSGVSIPAYWISTMLWDMIFFIIPMVISLIMMALFGVSSLIGASNIGATIVVMLSYGLCVGSLTYLLSFLFANHITAQNMLSLMYNLSGSLLLMAAMILSILPSTEDLYKDVLQYIFFLFPNFAMGRALFNLIMREQPLMWEGKTHSAFHMDIIGTPVVIMLCLAIGYFLLTIVIEYILSTPLVYSWFSTKKERVYNDLIKDLPDKDLDDDVAAERRRLQDAYQRNPNKGTGDTVQILGIQKCYPTKPPRPAVKSVYFGIPEGQCFGYLGVNGAGKTTTLRMLTGDEVPTNGTALLGGKDILSQQNQVRQLLGYCPQFDALIGELSARETLWMYARIKGYPEDRISPAVEKLIDKLSLQEYADRPCGSYSGGNKRKLSVGIALIGDPRIVFLDEPTSGVDPASRRFMWNLISTTMQGRSVILTTHSMEECEALCQNIAIMVAGQLKCLGTGSHLKNKFGNAYQVELNLHSKSATGEEEEKTVTRLLNWFAATFPGTSMVERHGVHIVARVPKSVTKLAPVFRCMEQFKRALHVRDYAVSETTLEQIFIGFAAKDENLAKNQENQDKSKPRSRKELMENENDNFAQREDETLTVKLYNGETLLDGLVPPQLLAGTKTENPKQLPRGTSKGNTSSPRQITNQKANVIGKPMPEAAKPMSEAATNGRYSDYNKVSIHSADPFDSAGSID